MSSNLTASASARRSLPPVPHGPPRSPHWLDRHDQEINPAWTQAPRLLGATATRAAEQQQFQALGQGLAGRLAQAVDAENPRRHRPLHVAILRSRPDDRNAWACWPAGLDAVLVTQGLIDQMQRVCSEIDALMTHALARRPDSSNPLQRLWAGMPAGCSDFASLGGLLATVAFGFIVHHELAHVGLGHDWIVRQRSTQPAGTLGPSDSHAAAGDSMGLCSRRHCRSVHPVRCCSRPRCSASTAVHWNSPDRSGCPPGVGGGAPAWAMLVRHL